MELSWQVRLVTVSTRVLQPAAPGHETHRSFSGPASQHFDSVDRDARLCWTLGLCIFFESLLAAGINLASIAIFDSASINDHGSIGYRTEHCQKRYYSSEKCIAGIPCFNASQDSVCPSESNPFPL